MEVINNIKRWVRDRNLHTSRPETAYVKFQEEAGEIASDLARGRDATDSIGDTIVTLVALCDTLNLDFMRCAEVAYNEIKDRKGVLRNDVFIKEGDYAS